MSDRIRVVRRRTTPALLAVAALAIGGSLLAAVPAAATETITPVTPSTTRFDDAYFVMQHNTYDYGTSMTSWLDQGFRAVEIDVIDREDWETDPNGPYVSHDGSPYNANCSATTDRLGNCLTDIASWQAAHPGSGSIEVFIDMKASWDPANAWNDDEVADLDQQVHSILGSRMYTADQLYQFAAGTAYTSGAAGLRNVVATAGWPTLASIGDRIVVDYTGGKVGLVNQTQGNGIDYEMSHTGHLPYGFFCPDVEDDPDELNPGGSVDGMSAATSAQVVCSNMDSQDHYEIAADRAAKYNQLMHLWGDHVFGNESYTYNYIAIAHGVTAIGRDATSSSDTFGGTLPIEGVRGSVPGYFELRASDNSSACVDARSSGTSNGTAIQRYTCNSTSAQRFVYTAEGQLRPQYDNPLCVDINGGSAQAGKAIHLWDCDGGSSEKWVIGADGSFRSFDNTAYCLTMPSSSGTQLTLQSCNGSAAQRFRLNAVASWVPTAF